MMTAPSDRTRCAIYTRLSKEDERKDQNGSESIQNQRSLLVSYAAEQGWDIYHIYCDEDYSGADSLRPDFNRMIGAARNKEFQILLCKSQSRFTRDMELVEKYIHGLFPIWGIRFIAVADHADTQIRGNKKARQINGLVNEWYLEDLSENIRMVLDLKRRQGQYIGASPSTAIGRTRKKNIISSLTRRPPLWSDRSFTGPWRATENRPSPVCSMTETSPIPPSISRSGDGPVDTPSAIPAGFGVHVPSGISSATRCTQGSCSRGGEKR